MTHSTTLFVGLDVHKDMIAVAHVSDELRAAVERSGACACWAACRSCGERPQAKVYGPQLTPQSSTRR